MTQTLTTFDYKSLGKDAVAVRESTVRIKALQRSASESVVEIGKELIEVKERLGHGQFGKWIEAEFGWSHDSTHNFIRVAKRFEHNPKISEYGASALYLLASPSTPDSAVAEAFERAEAGEEITHKVAKEIVNKHKPTAAHAELVEEPEDEDQTRVASILRGEHQDKYESAEGDEPEVAATRAFKTDAETLIEKVEKLVKEIDRMAAERMGHNAKSRAVVNQLNDTIPLIKAMGKSWRN